LQATFTTELIQRRKIYPAGMRNHLARIFHKRWRGLYCSLFPAKSRA
jgi:hypothetical protein